MTLSHQPSGVLRRDAVLLIIAAGLWSTSGLLVKVIDWPPLAILGARSLIASVVFLAYRRRLPRRVTRWQIVGAVAYLGTQLTFISATKLTTAANAIFLQYTAPIHVIWLAFWLLKERPQRADWLAMAAIFAGLLLFFGDQLSLAGAAGNGLAILSGVALALMAVCLRAQKEAVPAETILIGNLLGAGLALPATLGQNWSPANVAILVYLGVFQIGLSFILYSVAIRRVPALEATLLVTLEPILNPIWVFLVLGERPGPLALLGSLVVLAAVGARAVTGARPPAR
ncbi:MAG: DMT family transporter [Anaerolineales bacterium]|nr:DMT family transporter [Anaerolineales bacterium]